MAEEKTTSMNVNRLEERNIDLSFQLQGTSIQIGLPLSTTIKPNEMPFAAVDLENKDNYLAKTENRLVNREINRVESSPYMVEKIQDNGNRAIQLNFPNQFDADRSFRDATFTQSLQNHFETDRRQEYMQAAANWTNGNALDPNKGSNISYGDKQVNVSDAVAYDYYSRNFDKTPGYAGNNEKYKEIDQLTTLMEERNRFDNKHHDKSSEILNNTKHLSDAKHPYHEHYNQALKGLENSTANVRKEDLAASLVKAGADNGFKSDGPFKIMAGKEEGTYFAIQGEGPGGLKAKVNAYQVESGAAEKISNDLANTATQTVESLGPANKNLAKSQ